MKDYGKFVMACAWISAAIMGCGTNRPAATNGDGQLAGSGQHTESGMSADTNQNPDDGACAPGTFQCDGEFVFSCDESGKLTKINTCGEGTQCDSDTGDCVCAPACDGKQCGDDGCGGSCGDCKEGEVCQNDGICAESCPVTGTGRFVGTKVKQIVWKDSENAEVSLHGHCGSKNAVMLIETAGWCGTCAASAPMFKNWFKTYDPKGVAFIMDFGESPSGTAATVADAKAYKTKHGYPAGFQVVADPKWTQISQAVNHGSGTLPLPFFIVFDGAMNIRYIGGAAAVAEAEVKAVLNGEPPGALPDGYTCEGTCGAQAQGGCYCDDQCVQYGDCCPDACDLCGSCP